MASLRRVCRRYLVNKDMGLDPALFPPLQVANPCGIMAKTFPGDKFLLWEAQNVGLTKDSGVTPVRGRQYDVSLKGVADSYFGQLFHRNPSPDVKQWMDVSDPRFVNWMVCSTEGVLVLQPAEAVGDRQGAGVVLREVHSHPRQQSPHQPSTPPSSAAGSSWW